MTIAQLKAPRIEVSAYTYLTPLTLLQYVCVCVCRGAGGGGGGGGGAKQVSYCCLL